MNRSASFFTSTMLFALLALAACVPVTESDRTIALSTAPSQPVATATPAPASENVALLGWGRASAGEGSAQRAIDGDPASYWNAGEPAPHWFSLSLDDLYLVDRIELVITQTPAGPTTHEIWLGNGYGPRTLYKRFTDVPTQDGQTLTVAIEPARSINEVLIFTLDSPSYVAWRELRVFGSASELLPLQRNTIATGLELPVQVTHAGDSSGRLFVVEQAGRIRIIKDGALNAAPFLDISHSVRTDSYEQGLQNVAFPPNYATEQKFYVSYTNVDSDTVISRFTTSADPDIADPVSEEVVLKWEQPGVFHNGGSMIFGLQDGYLYIGSGDGGNSAEPNVNGQDPTTLLGKILRIDVESGVKPYSIPASNPFTQVDGYRDEIWALGLRNPWGFAFDRQTGDLYLPDAGDHLREEVNYQPAASAGGENYGWPIMEGNQCYDRVKVPCSADGLTQPVAEYDHTRGCAVVGGGVLRGNIYPRLQGIFIYSDFCIGHIWGLSRPDPDSQDGWQSTLLAKVDVPVSSIGEDEEGNVYVTGYQNGVVYLLTPR